MNTGFFAHGAVVAVSNVNTAEVMVCVRKGRKFNTVSVEDLTYRSIYELRHKYKW